MYIQRWNICMTGMVICTIPPCYMFVLYASCIECMRIFILIPMRAECHRNWFLQWLFSNYSLFVAYLLNLFVGMFSKLWKATISSVVLVSLSLSLSLSLHETTRLPLDSFSCNLILNIFRICVKKIVVSLKSDKSNRHFTWRPIYIFDHISLSSS